MIDIQLSLFLGDFYKPLHRLYLHSCFSARVSSSLSNISYKW